ncbi:MAG: HNH endonuclease [Endomicrobium sp.]|jgi:site-specific DNA-methyltransferase (adenine-specific)|nr:HNH endonuclease [Endomicrobium sp.]
MKNTLYTNDNLYIMNGMNSQSVDLIYLDPPFNSKRMYCAPIGTKAAGASFKDMWSWEDIDESYLETMADKYPVLTTFISSVGVMHSKAMKAYLTYMAQRIIEMYRILKDTGSMYLHCDPTASHYLKALLDEIFGKGNFRNEIVWRIGWVSGYKTQAGKFIRNHDIILYYTKSDNFVFNKEYITYPQNYVRRDGKKPTGNGIPIEDTWNCNNGDVLDSIAIKSFSKEKTGYPTQKPLALLRRIIKASSNEGDIVFDPFCGCATSCVAAQQLGRKWIGIDIEKQSVNVLIDRLSDDAGLFSDFVAADKPPKRTDIKEEPINQPVKQRLYADQQGMCRACGVKMDIFQFEIDHIIPKVKGGGDYYENYQLLCPHCNRTKGDRPMEYLRMKIKYREEIMKTKIVFGE